MAAHSRHVPAYRLHKPSGQARVIIQRKHHYLGKYGSPESLEKYHRLVADYVRPPADAVLATAGGSALSVKQIILSYWCFAETYYTKNGKPGERLYHVRLALRPLRKLYGNTLASEFGPRKLKNVREEMINAGLERGRGLNRNYINDHNFALRLEIVV
jgi:hypothetical protein